MKTILRIIAILIVAAVVAGGFSLAVNNSSIASGTDMEGGQPPVMTSADGQSVQPMDHHEGGEEGGVSITRGLSEVLVTLAKLAGITAVILLVQKTFSLLPRRKPSLAQ